MKKIILLAILMSATFSMLSAKWSTGEWMQWLDNKFSMFIHFGLYSELGGVWNEEKVKVGYSEQIMAHGVHYMDLYEQVAKDFNPTEWDPAKIVSLAKEAGMGSIVMTAKHHDGFCMYDSKYTEFNVVDATPYGKDILKSLADECKKQGLCFGIYFSLIDWNYSGGHAITYYNNDPVSDELHNLNMNQVRELMLSYCQISEFWFDMGSLTPQQSKDLYTLIRSIDPFCRISSRIGNDYSDFVVMSDNQLPAEYSASPWQMPASFYPETWGYRSWQKKVNDKKKAKEKLADLRHVVSLGGKYLLNIGPKGDGSVTKHEANVLKLIGKALREEPLGEELREATIKQLPSLKDGVLTEYATSIMDYFHKFRSRVSYEFKIDSSKNYLDVYYTEDEIGRKLNLREGDQCGFFDIESEIVLRSDIEDEDVQTTVWEKPTFLMENVEKTALYQWHQKEKISFSNRDCILPYVQKCSRNDYKTMRFTLSTEKPQDVYIRVYYMTSFNLELNGMAYADVKSKKVPEVMNSRIVRLSLKEGINNVEITTFTRFGNKHILFADMLAETKVYKKRILLDPYTRYIHVSAPDRLPTADMELTNLIFKQ